MEERRRSGDQPQATSLEAQTLGDRVLHQINYSGPKRQVLRVYSDEVVYSLARLVKARPRISPSFHNLLRQLARPKILDRCETHRIERD